MPFDGGNPRSKRCHRKNPGHTMITLATSPVILTSTAIVTRLGKRKSQANTTTIPVTRRAIWISMVIVTRVRPQRNSSVQTTRGSRLSGAPVHVGEGDLLSSKPMHQLGQQKLRIQFIIGKFHKTVEISYDYHASVAEAF